jgi:hypothetical protein
LFGARQGCPPQKEEAIGRFRSVDSTRGPSPNNAILSTLLHHDRL